MRQTTKRRAPREMLVGAHMTRRAARRSSDVEEEEPIGGGSDTAPTAKALERERLRHRNERRIGRAAAGSVGNLRDKRRPNVGRKQLAEAARSADDEMKRRRKPAARTGKAAPKQRKPAARR